MGSSGCALTWASTIIRPRHYIDVRGGSASSEVRAELWYVESSWERRPFWNRRVHLVNAETWAKVSGVVAMYGPEYATARGHEFGAVVPAQRKTRGDNRTVNGLYPDI